MFDEDFGHEPTVRIVHEEKQKLMSRELAHVTPTPVPVRPADLTETQEIEIPQWAIDSTR